MPSDDEIITPRETGQLVTQFLDIQRWWASAPANCRKSEATFTYLAFGIWGKIWEKKLEEEFTNTFGWSYDNERKDAIQKVCCHSGYNMKGCIAKNICHVKGELVKSLQKKGRQAEHGKTMKKRCCNEEAYNEEGNYIKRRAATVTVALKAEVEVGTEGIKWEEEAEVPPESSKTSIDNCDGDIDTIDKHVIISSQRKLPAAAAVSIKGKDEAIASVHT
jgi:hypothetical protein